GAEGAGEAGALGRYRQAGLSDDALTVVPAQPEIEERVFDDLVGFPPPAVGAMDFVDRNADADHRRLLRGGAMLPKPPPDHLDLEVGSAVAAARSAVGHANRNGDRPGVRPVQPLHERFRGPVASAPLEFADIESHTHGVRDGDLTDVREGCWMLAVVPDVGEQEGAEVDLS